MSARGFTLTEVLVVLGVMVLLGGLGAVAFANIRDHQALRVAAEDARGAILDARERTLASSGDSVHGVHIDENQLVRFVGATYDSGSADNEVIELPPTVTATSTLTGDAVDIVFERLTGAAAVSGTVTLVDERSGRSYTMTVYSSGLIE